jgi:RNA recognition motif-containing protein
VGYFRDGKSRQFAFIGFRTEREAEEAIKYFNRSYVDTCRVTCEVHFTVLLSCTIYIFFCSFLNITLIDTLF